jgi:hypothetical protein
MSSGEGVESGKERGKTYLEPFHKTTLAASRRMRRSSIVSLSI